MSRDCEKICGAAAAGNHNALLFLIALLPYVHLVDDLWDQDKPVELEDLAKTLMRFNEQLLSNPWVQERRQAVTALMRAGAQAWVDSHAPGHERARDVLKSQYHELVWYVANECGGWDHAREVARMFREFDFEDSVTIKRKEAA